MTQDLPKQDAVVLELSNDDLDEIEWLARDAPLRLVAQTIRSMGDKAKSAAIKKKLEGRIGKDFTWKTWWERVLPAVRESRYFLYRDRQPITLAARVDSIPDQAWESLPTPDTGITLLSTNSRGAPTPVSPLCTARIRA